MVEELDLRPPVNVRALVAAHADIRAWDFGPSLDCDAVMYGLRGERPRPLLVLNERRADPRTRFTLGHELGHIMLSWHAGTISCLAEETDEDDPATTPAHPVEREADAFASRILVPARFVAELASQSVPQMLKSLEQAEVSGFAGMRSLSSLLPPGYVFALLNYAGTQVHSWYTSPSTRNPGLSNGGRVDARELDRRFDEAGLAHHHGWTVWWGRSVDSIQVPPGSADWRTVLQDILLDIAPGEDPSSGLWRRITAVAAAANGAAKSEPRDVLAARIRHAYRLRPDLSDLVDHPRFYEYVLARTRDWRPDPA